MYIGELFWVRNAILVSKVSANIHTAIERLVDLPVVIPTCLIREDPADDKVCICMVRVRDIYIYVYICVCICMCIYLYGYIKIGRLPCYYSYLFDKRRTLR
jgi:hypothetical protein